MPSNAVEVLLRDCFGYRDREHLLVVAEPECATLAETVASGARDLGYPTALLVVPKRESPQAEPPEYVAEALRAAHLALIITPQSWSGSKALQESLAAGLRAAELMATGQEVLEIIARTPFQPIALSASALSAALELGRKVRVRAPKGTDFSFVAAGDREIRDGVVRDRGEFGTLPGGFVRVVTQAGTLSGEVRCDLWPPPGHADTGRLVMTFANGVLQSVSRPELREALREGLVVESVGFGLNPAVAPGASATESALAAKTGFLRLAHPASHAIEPILFVFSGPEIDVDGVAIPAAALSPDLPDAPPDRRQGRANDAAPVPDLGQEIFRLFFENSNDPQYALDLETQRIILANDAFLRLTGYARSEIASGRLNATDIVADESKDRAREKRAHRRTVPSERYELRIACADGSKKAVEVSVQRSRFQDREVVIGSLRDISSQERMKRDLTERATDAMKKTLEIYALTEKIKNVPKLTPALLSGGNEEEILARAVKILTQKPGLSYASATIYLIQEHVLEQRFPVPGPRSGPSRFDMTKGHRLARVARGEDAPQDPTGHTIALPLPGRDGIIGVLEVELDPKEAQVLSVQGGHSVRSEYQNLLLSVAQILALSIENLRLYNVVKEQSEIDQLTGVFNRRMFDVRLGDEVRRARRYGRDLALLMIDLDHFKDVNDTWGHQKGDETLRHISQFLRVQSRNVDVVSRYGGDEFCLLLPECNLENAILKAEAIRRRFVTRKFSVVGRGDQTVRLTLSIGVGALTEQVGSEHDLLKTADSALYRAKGQGRNRVCAPVPAPDSQDGIA